MAMMNNRVISNFLIFDLVLFADYEFHGKQKEFPDKETSIAGVADFFSSFQKTLQKGFL